MPKLDVFFLCLAVVAVVCLWAWWWGIFELTLGWNVQNVGEHKSEAADAAVLPAEHASKAWRSTFCPCVTHTACEAGEYTPDRALLTVIDEGKLVDEDWAPSAF